MIDKILVALEHRNNNSIVFESAISLAQTTGASLMLLHVLSESEANYPILPTYAYYPILDDSDYDFYQKQLEEYKQLNINFLRNLTTKANEAGVTTEYTQKIGNPGRKICELATTWEADLILVGSRGLKGIKEMFLGSVSNYVTHHAPCSVLIVRESIEQESHSNSTDFKQKITVKNI